MHILFGKFDLVIYWLITGVVTFISAGYIAGEIRKYREETGFLSGFDVFLRNLEHMYYEHHSPVEAIRSARYMSENREVCLRADEILEILETSDSREKAAEFFRTDAPDLVKKLASLAIDVTQTGDRQYPALMQRDRICQGERGQLSGLLPGSTLFLKNLERLTSETAAKLREKKRLHLAFRGMMALCVVPLYLLPFLIRQQTELMSVLADFYSGEWGMLITLLAPVISLVFLKGVICMKELRVPGKRQRRIDGLAAEKSVRWFTDAKAGAKWRNALCNRLRSVGEPCDMRVVRLRELAGAVMAFILVLAVLMIGNIKTRYAAMNDLSVLSDVGSIYTDGEKEILREYIPSFMKEYKSSGESFAYKRSENGPTGLTGKIRSETGIANELSLSRIAIDLEKRMEMVSTPVIRLHDLPAALLFAIAGWFMPILGLELTYRVAKAAREDEVAQLQSICLMKMHVPHMTVTKMLRSMEMFSRRFEGVISKTIDELLSGDEEAFSRMAAKTGSVHFSRLADCFRRVDRCGIEAAFSEIESQMESFAEDRKIDRQNAFEERSMIAGTLAAVPLYYVMCAAIIPYFVAILGLLESYATTLGGYL